MAGQMLIRPIGITTKSLLVPSWKHLSNRIGRQTLLNAQLNKFIPVLGKFLDAIRPAIDWFAGTGFLLAVPKKKVSARRKRIRNRNKFPQNRTDIETCVVCGNDKLEGHLCGHCLEGIMAETRRIQSQMPSGDLPEKLKHPLY